MSEEEDAGLHELKSKIRDERGFNAHVYKDKCLRRRFAVRMRARGLESFADYSALLDADPLEYDRLVDTLTINVTKFFRNPETWEVIAHDVIPYLMEGDAPVDVWSAGCASGEEPYSLSILLHEWAEAIGREADLKRVRIIGTDIDRGSLAAAEQAAYPEISFDDTPSELRAKWFSDSSPSYLRTEAKAAVGFRKADLISGDALKDQSLIICRNVIIYLDRSVQEQIFRTFYDSLLPGGILILGRVETLLGPTRGLFKAVSTRERIYQKPV